MRGHLRKTSKHSWSIVLSLGRGARPAQFKQAPRAQRREGRQGQLLSDTQDGNS